MTKSVKRKSKNIQKYNKSKSDSIDRDSSSDSEIDSDEISSDISEESVQILTYPNIIYKLSSPNIIYRVFSLNGDIMMAIRDSNEKEWIMAYCVCELLGYNDMKEAMEHIPKKYRKAAIDIDDTVLKTLPPQFMFINTRGLMSLISECGRSKFIDIGVKIVETLSVLFKEGSYTMCSNADIDRLNAKIYDDSVLAKYANSSCIYLAYVGTRNTYQNNNIVTVHMLKFGDISEITRYNLEKHYDTFNIIDIWETYGDMHIEDKINTVFESSKMIVRAKIHGVDKEEHITLTDKHNLDFCMSTINQIVDSSVFPYVTKHNAIVAKHNAIKELEHKNKMLETKYKSLETKYKSLNTEYEFAMKLIRVLNTDTNDLH